jgi:hypothetical protein
MDPVGSTMYSLSLGIWVDVCGREVCDGDFWMPHVG